MSNKKRINFQEIAERVDDLIDMVDNKSMIDDYRTTDLLNLVEKEFEAVTKALDPLPDIDLYKDM
jgi:hypothetical protein